MPQAGETPTGSPLVAIGLRVSSLFERWCPDGLALVAVGVVFTANAAVSGSAQQQR